MKKPVAILVLCLTFVFCAIGFSACSLLSNKSSSEISKDTDKIEEELTKDLPVTEDKYFDFTLLEDDTYSIKAKNGYEMPETVVLPAEHNGKKITVIEKEGFKDSRGLKSIILSDNITIIDDKAFEYSDELMSVTIPDSVKSIGYSAFEGCEALTAVIIGEGVTNIGKYAFEFCPSLISVTIGSNVNDIGSEAFHDCDKLIEICNKSSLNIIAGAKDNGYVGYYAKNVYTPTSGASKLFTDEKGFILYDKTVLVGYIGNEINVVLPEGVTEIYKYAFKENRLLIGITIPSSLKNIKNLAFSDCDRLVEICNKSSLTIIAGSTDNGGVGKYAKNIYKSGTSKLKTDKNGYVIYDNKSLIGYTGTETELTLPSGITEINSRAFYNCTYILNVTIPNSVTNIGEKAFYNCYWLESIIIPDSVTNIGERAFYYCEKLRTLTIGTKVAKIDTRAFDCCTSLIEVYNKSSIDLKPHPEYGYYNKNENVVDGYIGYYAKNIYTPTSGASKLTTDDKGFTLFDNKTLVAYTGSQTDLTLPSGITNIHALAFGGNRFLKNITIPDGVTSIGYGSFGRCDALTTITIPDSVTSIGTYAFDGCRDLTSITFKGTMEQWDKISKARKWDNYSVIKTIICTDGTIDL